MPHKKPKAPIVEPSDPPTADSVLSSAQRTLESGGCPQDVAPWLAHLLARVLPPVDAGHTDADSPGEGRVGTMASVWTLVQISYGFWPSSGTFVHDSEELSPATFRDCGMLATLALLMGELYAPRIEPPPGSGRTVWAWSIGEAGAVAVAREMAARGADFDALLAQGWPPFLVKELLGSPIDPQRGREKRVCRVLVQAGAIDQKLADMLTAPYPDEYVEAAASNREPLKPAALPDLDAEPARWNEIVTGVFASSFDFYLSCFGDAEQRDIARQVVYGTPETVRELAKQAAGLSQEQFTRFVGVIADAAAARWANSDHGRRFDIYVGHSPMWRGPMRAFAQDMREYFELADARVGARPSDASPQLRTLWMLLFRMAWDAESDACPSETRARLLAAANEDIARIRPLLTSATEADSKQHAAEFAEKVHHLRRCASLLAFHGGLWRMLKPMILALRAIKTRALAHDLRDWNEFDDDPPPQPWCELPRMITAVFHAMAGREQERDPDLERLRGEFGKFCMERLTDKLSEADRKAAQANARPRSNEDMLEPSATWRYAYVRAATALRINPNGTGHRTLHIAATIDPDDSVKAAAREAEKSVRHRGKLPENVSPRRAVMTALWFLKQAHMRHLGFKVDEDGAQRTRRQELTRTKEVERSSDSAAHDTD